MMEANELIKVGELLIKLSNQDFRLENDEEGFYFSIIDRQVYPRIWADNFCDGKNIIIAETPENILNRTVLIGKDWITRFFGTTLLEVLTKADEHITNNIINENS